MFMPLFTRVLPVAGLLFGLISPAVSAAYTPIQQRYLDAKTALEKGQYNQYKSLRKQLDDYPLAIYLDYNADIDNVLEMPSSKAIPYLTSYKVLPFYGSAKYRYLMNAGKDKRWKDFIAVSPTLPKDVKLQCYFYRSQLAQGNKTDAFKGAEQLWVYGYSRPAECDPLFDAWTKAGFRTQELVWSRLFAAFDAGETSLFNYLVQKVTKHASEAKRLQAVYKDPHSLRYLTKFDDKATIVGDIVAAGIRKLARKDLAESIKLYMKYQESDRFSDYQGRSLNRYLVRRALIAKDDIYKDYVDTFLPLLGSDDLYEHRLRWAMRETDVPTISKYLALLSPDAKAKERWQYWQAYMAEKNNQTDEANSLLASISQTRNFYGFVSSNALNQEVNLRFIPTEANEANIAALKRNPSYLRVVELLVFDKTIDARSEWVSLLKRSTDEERATFGTIAIQNKWYDFAVEASIQAKRWDDIGMRFPFAEQAQFEKSSQQQKVNINEIRAIARRESAFYPYATSGVGARGFMQLMPATAKETAKKVGIKLPSDKALYNPQLNIQLGSAYYASLLNQFNGNRVLATAAYNAGPHRVKRWLAQSQGKLNVMQFIETIPFTETREYVQAVLSYRVIYEVRQNKHLPMFTDAELNFAY